MKYVTKRPKRKKHRERSPSTDSVQSETSSNGSIVSLNLAYKPAGGLGASDLNWVCPCGVHNSKKKLVICRKCGEDRPPSSQLARFAVSTRSFYTSAI